MTSLKLLQQQLGADASLLDNLPVDELTMIPTKLEDYLSHKIRFGDWTDEGGKQWDVWALLTSTVPYEGMPQVRYVGFRKSHRPTVFVHEKFLENGIIRPEFRDFDRQTLSVILRACFIVKGIEMPEKTSYPPNFLKSLPTVCRQYKLRANRSSTLHRDQTPTPSRPARQSIRKSGSSGPPGQLFSLAASERHISPSDALHALKQAQPLSSPRRESYNRDPDSRVLGKCGEPALLQRAKEVEHMVRAKDYWLAFKLTFKPPYHVGIPTTAHAQVSMSPSRSSLTQAGSSSYKLSSEHVAPVARMTSTPRTRDTISPQSSHSTPGNDCSLQSESDTPQTLRSAQTQTEHMSSRTAPVSTQVIKKIKSWVGLRHKVEDVDLNISQLEKQIANLKIQHEKERDDERRYLDVQLPETFQKERDKLREEFKTQLQKALADMGSDHSKEKERKEAEYTELERGQNAEIERLNTLKDEKLKEMHDLEQERDREQDGLTKAELLSYTYMVTPKKRKMVEVQEDENQSAFD